MSMKYVLACGGWIRERQGVITNPVFPSQYENLLDCPWLVEVPEGKKIKFTLTYSNLEYQPQCLYDRLIIKLGPYYTSPTARTYCISSEGALQDSFTSNTNKVLVQFQTDHSRGGSGFRLEFQQVDQGCGYVDSGDNGSIASPEFPKHYSNNMYCRWEIVTSIGFYIVTHFVQFGVQKSDNCTKDYLNFEQLKVSSGRSVMEWSPLKGPYCGYDKPSSFASEAEHLRVTFKTDEKTAASGFKFNWTSVCGATYTSPSGYISSPYYPRNYNDNMYCVYMIMPPELGSIYTVLEFRTFELKGFIQPGKCGDAVEVIELFSNTTVATLCGSSLPDAISTKGPMQIVFKSDSSKTYHGFSAVYRVSECGGVININDEMAFRSAIVRLPMFPAKYQNNMKCDWIVTCLFDCVIDFKQFTNLSTEPNTNCAYDYVELRDGDNENSILIGKFCGIQPPMQHFKSTREKMFIRFTSDASNTRSVGFFGGVTGTIAQCGVTIIASSEYITSPNYPNPYSINSKCEWRINAIKASMRVVLKFDDLNFPENEMGNCKYARVRMQIYNGKDTESPLMNTICGSAFPQDKVVSTGDAMTVWFFSDYSNNGWPRF